MMQKLGNRRSIQKCAQKAGPYVLKYKNISVQKHLVLVKTKTLDLLLTVCENVLGCQCPQKIWLRLITYGHKQSDTEK